MTHDDLALALAKNRARRRTAFTLDAGLDEKGFSALLNYAESAENWTALDLGLHVTDARLETVIAHALPNQRLRLLALRGSPLSHAGMRCLAGALLAPNCALESVLVGGPVLPLAMLRAPGRVLQLAGMQLDDADAVFITGVAAHRPVIEEFDLSGNAVREEGALAICEALERGLLPRLRRLRLGRNPLSAATVSALGRVLARNGTLEELWLAPLSPQVAVAETAVTLAMAFREHEDLALAIDSTFAELHSSDAAPWMPPPLSNIIYEYAAGVNRALTTLTLGNEHMPFSLPQLRATARDHCFVLPALPWLSEVDLLFAVEVMGPQLRVVDLTSVVLSVGTLGRVLDASLPRLERLSLNCAPGNGPQGLVVLVAALASRASPTLLSAALLGCCEPDVAMPPEFCEAAARLAERCPRLKSIVMIAGEHESTGFPLQLLGSEPCEAIQVRERMLKAADAALLLTAVRRRASELRVLRIERCRGFGVGFWPAALGALREGGNGRLEALVLRDAELFASDAQLCADALLALASMPAAMARLGVLDVSDNGLERHAPLVAADLARALFRSAPLLEDLVFTAPAPLPFAQLSAAPRIARIDLRGLPLGTTEMRAVAAVLAAHSDEDTRLEALCLEGAPLGDGGISVLAELLASAPPALSGLREVALAGVVAADALRAGAALGAVLAKRGVRGRAQLDVEEEVKAGGPLRVSSRALSHVLLDGADLAAPLELPAAALSDLLVGVLAGLHLSASRRRQQKRTQREKAPQMRLRPRLVVLGAHAPPGLSPRARGRLATLVDQGLAEVPAGVLEGAERELVAAPAACCVAF